MSKKNSLSHELRVLTVQMNSTEDRNMNFQQVEQILENHTLIDLIVLPEVFNFRSALGFKKAAAEPLTGPTVTWLKETAQKQMVFLIAGSITELAEDGRIYNTTVVLNPAGEIIKTYRKMHLFDVTLADKSIQESAHFSAGEMPNLVEIQGWQIGLTICYDLRFPELFRHYFKHHADMIVIPSSFTYETGQKHWRVLCQARAIENQCYIIAPNQCGVGAGQVKTYGHSLVIDPDGNILVEANDNEVAGFVTILSKAKIDEIRSKIPVRNHIKQWESND
ncbi:MAG: carbon-nitrogen hydrolase family protein [Candidatus Margulisiibacteriota bacterium]